eukprot:gene23806-9972_t
MENGNLAIVDDAKDETASASVSGLFHQAAGELGITDKR